MERLQRPRRRATAVLQNRPALERPFARAWAGAENGDVVLVAVLRLCLRLLPQVNADVERLLREDPRLKVVWREYPVLGPNSEAAAVASLAAAEQGRWRQFHARLFALGRPTAATVQQAVRDSGITTVRSPPTRCARRSTRNSEMARAIGATGTPTFVVGDQVLQGAVGYEALKAAIAAGARGAAARS